MTAELPQLSNWRTRLVPVRAPTMRGRLVARGERVALRQLVIATDIDDFQLPAWETILYQIGTPYDILFAKRKTLSTENLVRTDGVGRYNAVLLTSGALLSRNRTGQYVSAFSHGDWVKLWDYERTFHVRQVALNAAPSTEPEDYWLRPQSESAVGTSPVLAHLTTVGAEVFDYLNPAVQLPISGSYVYRTRMAEGCPVQPLLTLNSDVLGVLSTARDGRERAALTFVLNAGQPVTNLLGYGLLRWATRGIFFGEQRHWISVDVDDWFNVNAHGPAGTLFRLSGPEAAAVSQQQSEFRKRYPLAAGFKLHIAYNGNNIDPSAAQCPTLHASDTLIRYSRSLRHDFRWINHTLTHRLLDFTSHDENYREISDNLAAAASIGLPVPRAVLKSPAYSGLGVYNPDSKSLGRPTDFGLLASNKALLEAASDLGVKYLHGNMSFASHQPGCFNCGIYHPLQPDLLLVPDWPTNIAFDATTPQEQVSSYNAMYGVTGTVRPTGRNVSYDEFVAAEADLAFGHVMTGSAYSHTLHQANLHQYAPGKCLAFDWLGAVLARYSACYQVPLQNPAWLSLAAYVRDRTAHYGALSSGRDAVWDRVTNAITYTSAVNTALFLTGLAARPATAADQGGPDDAELYGSDLVSRLRLAGGQAVTLVASPRS